MAEEVIFGGEEDEEETSQESLSESPSKNQEEDENREEPEKTQESSPEIEKRLKKLEDRLENVSEDLEVDEIRERLQVVESNTGVEADVIEDLEERLEGLENKLEDVESRLQEGIDPEEVDKIKEKIEDVESDEVGEIRSEVEELKERLAEKSDLISEVRENLLGRIKDLENSDEVEKVKVEIDNLEKRIEEVEEESDQDVSEFEDRLAEVEGSVSDFKWIFNDFDDLADLKLLTKDEFEDVKRTEAEEPDRKRLNRLQRKIDRLEETQSELNKKLDEGSNNEGLLERVETLETNTGIEAEVIEDLEDRIEELESQRDRDLGSLIDEMDRQEDQIQDIRKGYKELGEMMQLILKELRQQRDY